MKLSLEQPWLLQRQHVAVIRKMVQKGTEVV